MPTYRQTPVNNYAQRPSKSKTDADMARALIARIQSAQPDPNAMVSGRVVPINPLGVALNTFSEGMADSQLSDAENEQKKIEDDRRSALAQALSNGGKVTPQTLADNGASADDILKFALTNQPKEPDPWKNTPTGYRPNPDGTISSMIDKETGQPYSAIQLERAIAAKQTPGYGQEDANARAEESLRLAQENNSRADEALRLQQDNAARSAQQQQISNDNEQERIRMAQESAAKQEQYHKESQLQQVPAMHRMAYMNNNAELQKIDDAIATAEKNPDAFGLQNILGDKINQRLNPAGTDARAKVAEIGAVKRHELSGAAVTASETPSLLPFVPSVSDNQETIIKKLKNLRNSISVINNEVEQMYSNPSDYKNAIVNPAGVPKSAQYNGVVSKFKLSDKAAKMPPEILKSITEHMNNGTDKDKLKLLNSGLIMEGE